MFQLLLKSSVFSLTSPLPTAFLNLCVHLRRARSTPHPPPTPNDSSADAAVTVLFPAVMICVLRDLIADPQWFVITSCYWLLSSVCRRPPTLCLGCVFVSSF